MLKKRSNDQRIEYTWVGAAENMPSGIKVCDGDDVTLNFDHYDLGVENIKTKSDSLYSGTLNSITDQETDKELAETSHFKRGQEVEFSEINIFGCTKNS